MIYKIKSKYILKNIFNYIANKNIQMKLFFHSKYFRNRLDLDIVYKKIYLDFFGFNLKKYLHKKEDDNDYNIYALEKEYNSFLFKNNLKKEAIENIIFELLDNQFENKGKYYINIESPLLELVSKTKDFEKKYTIYISQKITKEFGLKEYKTSVFDKLNTENIKYSSISYIFEDITKLDQIKELNINYNNIKKMELIYNGNKAIISDEIKNKFKELNVFKNLKHLLLKGIKFELLEMVVFNELIKLNLSNNHIKDINALKSVKFDSLEKLYLNDNEIKNIKVLKYCELNKLKELNLSYNYIQDINILEISNFNNLEILRLNNNKISDIKVLEICNFKELKELYLNNNKITRLDRLGRWNFKKLKILNISHNKISDIDILNNCSFVELKKLDLSHNNISDIKVLAKVKFAKLEKLYLKHNFITDINILEKCVFNKLIKLDLTYNNISDIEVLERVKFPKLEKLYLNKKETQNVNNYFKNGRYNEVKEFVPCFNKISSIKEL